MPSISKINTLIKGKINKFGTGYSTGSNSFKGLLYKADVARDLNRLDYTLVTSYNASIISGEIVHCDTGTESYIQIQSDTVKIQNSDSHKKIYVKIVNSTGTIKRFVNVTNASKDNYGRPIGVEGVDYGWIPLVTNASCSIRNVTVKALESEDIGRMRDSMQEVFWPWSISASIIPQADDRFIDENSKEWIIRDIDSLEFSGHAYKGRISPDDRGKL